MRFDLTTITLVWLAGSAILIPLMILVIRLAVIPLLEAISRPRSVGASADGERIARLEEKVGRMSQELEEFARRAAPAASN